MTKATPTQHAQFRARLMGEEHPEGLFDKSGRWYPSDQERSACCAHIRQPSCAHPYSLLRHCRTLRHIMCRDGEREAVVLAELQAASV